MFRCNDMPATQNDEARVLKRWKVTRVPALADTLDRLASDDWLVQVKELSKLNIEQASRSVPKLMKRDDPRISVFIVNALLAARWPSFGSQGLWTKLFSRLVKLRDRRAIEPLRQAARAPPQFIGIAHTKWMVAQLEATASALEEACASLPLEDETGAQLIATVKHLRPAAVDGAISAPKGKLTGDAAKLLEAIWARPDDDEVRRVAADGLLELNDPWGEFITLQFRIAEGRATPAEKKRADSLLHRHGVRFGGPIAAISTKNAWAFEKGLLVKCAADRSMVARRLWADALEAPHWATVQTLSLTSKTPQWWVKALLAKPTLRSLRTLAIHSARIVRESTTSPWRLKGSSQASARSKYPIFGVVEKALRLDLEP